MKCDLKTMIKVGLVLGAVLIVGAIAFPQFRPAIVGLAPFVIFALCPISMFFAMRAMDKGQHNEHSGCAACEPTRNSDRHAEKHNHGESCGKSE